jgi:hypothetical protein
MRKGLIALSTPLAALGLLWACGHSQEPASPTTGADASDEIPAYDGSLPDVPYIPGPDGPITECKLGDMTDPVQFCAQRDLLKAEIQNAYSSGRGLASSWDALTGATSGHSWADDLGLASAIASYQCSATIYGDTELAALLSQTLSDLAHVLSAELPNAPDGYDGETYFRLRNAAAGFYALNDTVNADRLARLADDYGRALQSKYAQAVPALPPIVGDAGADGSESGDAGAADAGSGSALLGVMDGNGAIEYSPAQVVMGAAALLDMASLHADDPDAGADRAAWQATAVEALDYVWRRARDPATGLFYQSLVTSGDAAHDALGPGTPTSDALLTDVQARVVLGLARAQDRYNSLPSVVDAGGGDGGESLPPNNYLAEADAIIESLVAAKLWHGSASASSDPGAFLEGIVPSAGGALLSNQTTLSNAYVLAAVIQIRAGSTSAHGYLVGQLIAALVPSVSPHSNFLSILTNTQDQVIQQDYLRAGSRAFDLAVSFSPDGGASSPEPGATSYTADALAAVVESFTTRWRERPNMGPCGP